MDCCYIRALICSLFLLLNSCSNNKDLIVDYKNEQIKYSGRVDTTTNNAAEIFWSGSSIKINFEGKSISALLEDEHGDNYFNVIIDKDSLFILRVDTTKKYYDLASGLSGGKHTVEIFKRTEWSRGKTNFYGFEIKGSPKLLPKPQEKKRKIEFYGNSITAGYANEDKSGMDSPDSIFTNNYLSYSALVARHYDAEYHCICKSGIGVMVSWFPLIMPEMYNRLNPADAASKWDFSLFVPDIVVVNLFQNDSWLVNLYNHQEHKSRFGSTPPNDEYIVQSYANFISLIREEYENAHIICALGSMDATKEGSVWPKYIKKAVEDLNDPKVYCHFMPYKDSPGHPSVEEHEQMAKGLIEFIDENIEW